MKPGKLITESCTRHGVPVFRRWWVEETTQTALGVAIDGYALTTQELEMLQPLDPDWWYLCDIEELATLLAPWSGHSIEQEKMTHE